MTRTTIDLPFSPEDVRNGTVRTEEDRLRDRCDRLWHALAVVLRVSMRNEDESDDHRRAREWAVAVFGGDAEMAESAMQMALTKYVGNEQ